MYVYTATSLLVSVLDIEIRVFKTKRNNYYEEEH